MMPFMPSHNGYALHFAMVIFHKADMSLEGRDVFPGTKVRCINQKSDCALLLDERIDRRRKLLKVVGVQFFGHRNFQNSIGDRLGCDHYRGPLVHHVIRARNYESRYCRYRSHPIADGRLRKVQSSPKLMLG
jgi:hypothetical protein